MIDLTSLTPLEFMGIAALLFLAAVGAVFLGGVIFIGFWSMRMPRVAAEPDSPAVAAEPPMLVVAPWSDAGASDVLAGDVLWRHRTEAEAAPTFASTPLPAHESVWNFKPFNLADPEHTQAWAIIKGYDADDLDPGPEPKVDPNTRRRFIRSDAEMLALAVAQGFPVDDQPRQRHAVVDAALAEVAGRLSKRPQVDLEAGTVVVS